MNLSQNWSAAPAGNLGNERANQLSFSCERMAGFAVKKSCVHQNPLVFLQRLPVRFVLFPSIVFTVQPIPGRLTPPAA